MSEPLMNPKATKYDVVVHLEDTADVHTREVRWIGHDQVVLECGCDTGYVAKVLAEHGCRVTGIEQNPAAAEAARQFCDEVFVGDLDDFDFERELGDRRFDVVLCGDVLEHLKDPWSVLERVRSVLKPGGRVVASIPNIAERNVVLNLILGRFEYQKLGLLDETHIRFFTAGTVQKLFESTGYVVARIERVENEVVEREVPVDLTPFPPEVMEFLQRQNPDFRTIQFLVEAYPATEAGTIASLRAQLRRAEEEQERLREVLRELDQRLQVEQAQAEDRQRLLQAEFERRLLASQENWAQQVRLAEARFDARLVRQTATLEAEASALAASEAHWRARAEAADATRHALLSHPAIAPLRRLRRLLRPGGR